MCFFEYCAQAFDLEFLISILNQLVSSLLPCFLAQFWRFFILIKYYIKHCTKLKWSVFFLVSSLNLRSFLLIKPSVFPPHFFIEFRKFFYQFNIHDFLLNFQLGLRSFFYPSHNLKLYMFVRACIQEKRQL